MTRPGPRTRVVSGGHNIVISEVKPKNQIKKLIRCKKEAKKHKKTLTWSL
jgi:hypothetical protein